MSPTRWKRVSYWCLVAAGAILVLLTISLLNRTPLTGPRRVEWPEVFTEPQTRGVWYVGNGFWTIADEKQLAYVDLGTGMGRKAADLDEVNPKAILSLRPAQDGMFCVFREKKADNLRAGLVSTLKQRIPLQTLRVPGQGRTHLLGVGLNAAAPELVCLRGDKLCSITLSPEGQTIKELLVPPDTRAIGAYQEANSRWVVLVLMDDEQIFLSREMRVDVPGDKLPPKSAGTFDLSRFGVTPETPPTLKLLPGGKVSKSLSPETRAVPQQFVNGEWVPMAPIAARPVVQNTPRTVNVADTPVSLTQWGNPLTTLWPRSPEGSWLCSDSGQYYVQLDRSLRRADPLSWPEHLLSTRARDRAFNQDVKRFDNLLALAWILLGFPLALVSGALFPRARGLDLVVYLVTAAGMLHFLSPLFLS